MSRAVKGKAGRGKEQGHPPFPTLLSSFSFGWMLKVRVSRTAHAAGASRRAHVTAVNRTAHTEASAERAQQVSTHTGSTYRAAESGPGRNKE